MGEFIAGFLTGVTLFVGIFIFADLQEKNNCARDHNVFTCEKVVTYVPVGVKAQ
jgi:hypothetical protein